MRNGRDRADSWQPTQARDLARLEADEAAHAPQFHAVLVEQLEIDRRVGRHAEMRAAVAFHRHVAEDADGRPTEQVLALGARAAVAVVLAVTLAAALVVVGPADRLGDAQVADLPGRDALGAVADVADRAGGVVFRRHRSGRDRPAGAARGRSGMGMKQEMAGSR